MRAVFVAAVAAAVSVPAAVPAAPPAAVVVASRADAALFTQRVSYLS